MRLRELLRDRRRRKARKRYEREQELRTAQDEGGVDRVAERAKTMGGGGLPSGGGGSA